MTQLLTDYIKLKADNALLRDAIHTLLNIEGTAMAGMAFKAWDGLNVKYHFNKARRILKTTDRGEDGLI